MTRSSAQISAGILYVVATPIGNLGDIGDRARDVLRQVSVVAAEDTRHSGQLLKHLGIEKSLVSLHEHNEARRAKELIERLHRGEDIALVSDAGTPLISDPGFDVVRQVTAAGLRAVPIPGACAAIAALSVAGLPTDRFVFEGFLPGKATSRREHLRNVASELRTIVFYEAPHRLKSALQDMADCLAPERRAVVARELTKQFETLYYGTLAELATRSSHDEDMTRGEAVIVVAGSAAQERSTDLNPDKVLRVLLEELPASQAAKLAARLTGAKRADLYNLALSMAGKRS